MKPVDRAWRVRPVVPQDEDLIAGLLSASRWQHRHLDWFQPEDLLGQEPYLLASEHGIPLAALACPPDPPGVAWIRLLTVASGYDLESSWRLLWRQAKDMLIEQAVERAAALSIPPWLPDLLNSAGFTQVDTVLFLEWPLAPPPAPPELHAQISPLQESDLAAVAELDVRAFNPLWRHSLEALRMALEAASYARVVRSGDRLVAYQISTQSAHGGHLARLAVDPEEQGRGLATALVADVLRHFHGQHLDRVTVNTQGSNERGQGLYARFGFRRTGQEFPIFQHKLAG